MMDPQKTKPIMIRVLGQATVFLDTGPVPGLILAVVDGSRDGSCGLVYTNGFDGGGLGGRSDLPLV